MVIIIGSLPLIASYSSANAMWRTAEGKENGWKHYASFGWFSSESRSSNQIFHIDHGGLWAVGFYDEEEGVWLYDHFYGWFWTSSAHYPNVYSSESNSWLTYQIGSKAPRRSYSHDEEAWIDFPPGGGTRFVEGELFVGITEEIKEDELKEYLISIGIEWIKFYRFPKTVSFILEIEVGRDKNKIINEIESHDLVKWAGLSARPWTIGATFNISNSLGWTILEANRFMSDIEGVLAVSEQIYSKTPSMFIKVAPGSEFEMMNMFTSLSFVRHAQLNIISSIR